VHSVPEPRSPENLGKPSGRGLRLTRRFMDQIAHKEIGNEVTMIKRLVTVPEPSGPTHSTTHSAPR